MIVYLSMIILVGVVAFIYSKSPKYSISNFDGDISIQQSKRRAYLSPAFILVLLAFLVPYIIRYKVGTDFGTYRMLYDWHMEFTFNEILDKRDVGYYALERFDYIVSGGSWYFHCFIIGIIIYAPIVYCYMRFSNDYVYTVLIYIFFMGYFDGYNGIRQSMATSMVILAICIFFLEKRKIPSILLIIIAYTFHSTVLIVVPLMLLCLIDYRKILLNVAKLVMLASIVVLPSLWDRIMELLGAVGQDKLINDYSDLDLDGETGANILRVMVFVVPVILAIIFAKSIIRYLDDNSAFDKTNVALFNFMINAVQFCAIFMIASLRNWIFARIASYFAIFIPIFLSYISINMRKEYKIYYKAVSYLLFFVYMCMLLPVESNLLPFRTEWGWEFN